ncbi:hypothetical protein ENKNEFLB_04476 [Nocardioides aquaticus]|uniref:DUF1707 domain-containing protein n=1 Tax=Nocardioides aquaticus TaxID=160826 RepID=A0ABX8EPA6_9ACTN|nr:hypothetical protein [Nocardioides aquaticus]QVT82057.1 hypothetical protein ENKNEFLB_04476 [Nocardioides aquaticus]
MPDRDPTPREEAALRRLLRDARHDGPVPPEVAARTEETLASLGAGQATTAPAVHGGADHHRRRRVATALLVAAVSVVVVGIGTGQVLRPASDQASGGAASESAGSAARDTPPDRAGSEDEAAQESTDELDTLSEPSGEPDGAGRRDVAVERLALVDDPPAVRETRFARDVRRVRALQQVERGERSSPEAQDGAGLPARDPAPGFTCAQADFGPGRPVAVRYEEAPAVLVLRPATRATQVADLVECRSGDVLRSVTLPR